MKNQELKTSLIRSGSIVALFIFFIYAFAVEGSGGVGGTIASMFTGLLFLIGLSIALVFCVTVMFGIYFGVLYLYDKDTCANTYAELKEQLADSAQNISCCPIPTRCSGQQKTNSIRPSDELNLLQHNHDNLEKQLLELKNSFTALEDKLLKVSSSLISTGNEFSQIKEKLGNTTEELATMATESSVEENVNKLSGDITAVQGTVQPLSDKLTQFESTLSALENSEKETMGRDSALDEMNNSLNDIKKELVSMKSSIKDLESNKSVAVEDEPNSDELVDEKHRILSYFTKKTDENKFVSLVAEAVSKGLTYAQIDEFLKGSLSADATKVISGHPSLTKDYIKTIRQNS